MPCPEHNDDDNNRVFNAMTWQFRAHTYRSCEDCFVLDDDD
jgi:hypothetical protein